MARAMGRRGGQARSKRLSATRRRQIAALGGRARHEALLATRRILENLRYAEAVQALQGGPTKVARQRTCRGPLPGIYLDQR